MNLSARSIDLSSRSVLTGVVAAGIAVASSLHVRFLAGLLLLVVLVLAWGLPRLIGLPAKGGSSIVIGLVGVGGMAAVYTTPHAPWLRNLPLVLAMGVVLAFVNELLRAEPRPHMVESVAGTVTGLVMVASSAGWIATQRMAEGEHLVVIAAIGLAVASVAAAVPVYGWSSFALTVLAGVAASAAAVKFIPTPGLTAGIAIGAMAGLLIGALHMLLSRLPSARGLAGSAAAIVMPIAVAGTLVYPIARLTLAG